MRKMKESLFFLWKNNIVFRVIILNFLYMFGMLLFFEPFLSITDYNMAETCYGVYDGFYNYHTMFEHFWYGRLVVFFLKLVPNIPWYTVLFYVWIFTALSFMTYILLSWRNDSVGLMIVNIFLLFFAYEGYISIHFTKVAGIVGGIGFFAQFVPKLTWKSKALGGVLMALSAMIRYNMMEMLIGVWFLAMVAKLILDKMSGKRIVWREIVMQLCCLAIGALMLFAVFFVPKDASEEEAVKWENIFEWNYVRSGIQDYAVPDYDENIETYEELGVTENDLSIWHKWNNDSKVLTIEVGEAIIALQERKENLISKVFKINNIISFFKRVPIAFFTIDVYIAFLAIVVCTLLWFRNMNSYVKYGGLIFAFLILLVINYYLFINQRYLQHRVDVGIIFNICLIYLFFLMSEGEEHIVERNTWQKIFCIISFIILWVPFQYYGDDVKYIDDRTLEINRRFFENVSLDTEHCYLIGNTRDNATIRQRCYGAFERFSIAAKSNVFLGCKPEDEARWEAYGIENPYKDIVDNEKIYLVLGDDDSNQDEWELYFEERTGKSVEITLVKKYLNNCIYRVHTKSIDSLLEIDKFEKNSKIVCDVDYKVKKGKLSLEGQAYLKGKTGFTQNAYVQIVDKETGDMNIYPALQTSDIKLKYGEEGYFSQISARIDLPKYYNVGDEINIILEDNKKYYLAEAH